MLTNEELQKIREVRIHKILGIRDDGRVVQIKCPLHSEKTASFTLYPDGGFKCFGCNKHGANCIDFVVALGYSFQEALTEIYKYI